MPRTSLVIPQYIYDKVEENAKTNNLTISQYLRKLIELGLRVEEMSGEKNNSDEPPLLTAEEAQIYKKVLKKGLTINYEMLQLARHIIIALKEDKAESILQASKEKAESFVEGLIHSE
mgnify:FL=1